MQNLALRHSGFELKQYLGNLKHALEALMIYLCPSEIRSKYGRSPNSKN